MKNLSLVLVALFFGLQLSAKEKKHVENPPEKHWMSAYIRSCNNLPATSAENIEKSKKFYLKIRKNSPAQLSQEFNDLYGANCQRGTVHIVKVQDAEKRNFECQLECQGDKDEHGKALKPCFSKNGEMPDCGSESTKTREHGSGAAN